MRLQLVRNAALAGEHAGPSARTVVQVGEISNAGSLLSGLAILGAVGGAGMVLLVAPKPLFVGLGAVAGLFIGSKLDQETSRA